MQQGLLGRHHVGRLAPPNLQSRLLNGAGKRKRQRPRRSRLESDIHGIQTGGSQFGGLAARQECDRRNGCRDGPQETPHCGVGHLGHRRLLGAGRPRKHHVGLQDHALEHHSLRVELVENRAQDFLRYLAAPLQGMPAVHEHFRLDDGDQSGFLAQGGIAGQGVRVGFDATAAGNAVAQGDHRAPLGKTGAHLRVLGQAITQSVQTLGYFLSGMAGHVLGPGVDFDAGNDSCIGDGFDKGRAVSLALADRLVVEDRCADALAQAGRGHDQLPIGPPGFLGLGNTQCAKSSVDGRIAFIHSQQALVAGEEHPRDASQVLRTHLRSPTSGSEFSRSQMRRISKYMNAAVQPMSTSPVNASIPAMKRSGPDGTRSP